MNRKESRQFNISVEGINCELMYFKHVAKLINSSDRSTYNLKVDPKKMSPMEYAKRNAYRPVDKLSRTKDLPYIHIQDIEDYHDDFQKEKFFKMIDEMRRAEKQFKLSYTLGYSNYTFELWMLLHVADMGHAVQNRGSYLTYINRYFDRNYSDIDEFKRKDDFQKILDEFVALDSIMLAISRAEKIVKENEFSGKVKETHKGFTFYQDNPDISVHEVLKTIFGVCKVK